MSLTYFLTIILIKFMQYINTYILLMQIIKQDIDDYWAFSYPAEQENQLMNIINWMIKCETCKRNLLL